MACQSTVIIAPASDVQAVNAALEAAGWGPGNLSVPLSADGAEPVTHYGCRAQAESTAIPQGLTTAMVDLRPHLSGHWDAVIAQLGLQRIAPPAPPDTLE